MPLYEYRKNAENHVAVPAAVKNSIVCGAPAVCERLVKLLVARKNQVLAVDGWYGVDWQALAAGLRTAAKKRKLALEIIHSADLFRSETEIEQYRQPFVTDDPSFGKVNGTGVIEDLLDPAKVAALKQRLAAKTAPMVVIGPGAAVAGLSGLYDVRCYADFTMQPLLWQMWDGKLATFGRTEPAVNFLWKKYYYCDFYLLLRQKKTAFAKMDYYIEAVEADHLKLMPAAAYNTIIDELVKQPIKQVKITQPGPWGSYRFKEIYDPIPGLENMAWNELAGIELSILVDVGAPELLNMPCQNIMQRPVSLVGKYVHKTYPDLLPLQVWLDDGYFKDPVPHERGSMPIHNHPDTEYVKRNFNEPLGRYETYYIVEAYHDAGTMMGFKEDADLEEYERLCRDSNIDCCKIEGTC